MNARSIALILGTIAWAGVTHGQGGAGRGGGLPGATPDQTQAVAAMNAALAPQSSAVTAARSELTAVTFSPVKDDAAIKAAVEKVRTAEIALATRRAEEFGKLQSGPNKLSPDQIAALIAPGGNPAAGRGGRGGAPFGGAPAGGGAPPAGRGN